MNQQPSLPGQNRLPTGQELQATTATPITPPGTAPSAGMGSQTQPATTAGVAGQMTQDKPASQGMPTTAGNPSGQAETAPAQAAVPQAAPPAANTGTPQAMQQTVPVNLAVAQQQPPAHLPYPPNGVQVDMTKPQPSINQQQPAQQMPVGNDNGPHARDAASMTQPPMPQMQQPTNAQRAASQTMQVSAMGDVKMADASQHNIIPGKIKNDLFWFSQASCC